MRNRHERTTAKNRAFTLLEVMAAIGVLVLGLVAILAVFVDRVPALNKSQETKTAALAMRSIANALELAFATPINPESSQTGGAWDPQGGPKIRIDHRGLFFENRDEPEGFALINLPGTPSLDSKPSELIEVRWPLNEDQAYSLARPPRVIVDPTDGGSGDGTPPDPEKEKEDEPIDLMNSYSFSITFKNWRKEVRTKVPSGAGATTHSETKSARQRPYDLAHADDELQTGKNLGYLVTVRIFRNYSALTADERQAEKENPTLVLKQKFLFHLAPGFGVTQ